MTDNRSIQLQPLKPAELAGLYHVSAKTMKTWLRRHEDKIGKRDSIYYTVRQVKMIFECIGAPDDKMEDV